MAAHWTRCVTTPRTDTSRSGQRRRQTSHTPCAVPTIAGRDGWGARRRAKQWPWACCVIPRTATEQDIVVSHLHVGEATS